MTDLLLKVETFVLHLFKDKLSSIYVYHNFNHTKRVVKNAEFLADKKNLGPQDKNILLLAAWFHDTGFTRSNESHEKEAN